MSRHQAVDNAVIVSSTFATFLHKIKQKTEDRSDSVEKDDVPPNRFDAKTMYYGIGQWFSPPFWSTSNKANDKWYSLFMKMSPYLDRTRHICCAHLLTVYCGGFCCRHLFIFTLRAPSIYFHKLVLLSRRSSSPEDTPFHIGTPHETSARGGSSISTMDHALRRKRMDRFLIYTSKYTRSPCICIYIRRTLWYIPWGVFSVRENNILQRFSCICKKRHKTINVIKDNWNKWPNPTGIAGTIFPCIALCNAQSLYYTI